VKHRSITNNDASWVEMTGDGVHLVLKSKPDILRDKTAEHVLTSLNEKVLSKIYVTSITEETIDGEDVYTLTASLPEDYASVFEQDTEVAELMGASTVDSLKSLYKLVLRFTRKTLLIHSGEAYDRGDNELASFKLTNIQINPSLPNALFEYTPPEGVKVIDMEETLKEENANVAK
jgi:outer membrane lipoprotein-sorting protein